MNARDLPWRVRNSAGEVIADMRDAEDAAAVITLHGEGSSVSYRPLRFTVWVEGAPVRKVEGEWDSDAAWDSYDAAAELMLQRVEREERRRLAVNMALLAGGLTS